MQLDKMNNWFFYGMVCTFLITTGYYVKIIEDKVKGEAQGIWKSNTHMYLSGKKYVPMYMYKDFINFSNKDLTLISVVSKV